MLKSKKGFTIVELVIVIAVIAILAAVLIPSFSSLNKKAKDSAYLQERTNQQISDLAEKVENQKFLTWEDLEAKLAEEIAKIEIPEGSDLTEAQVTDAIAKAIAKLENSLKTDDTALTEAQVKAIVEKALEGQLTTAQVEAIVKDAVKNVDGSDLTADQVKTIVDAAVAGLDKQTGITKEEMADAIAKAVEGKSELKATDVESIITDALAGFGYGNDLSASQIENIIKNAMAASKLKADELAVEEMNDIIDASGATSVDAAVKALTAAGYNVSALTPIREGYIFTWNGNAIACELDNDTNKDIVNEGAGLVVADVASVADFNKAIANGNTIKLTADLADIGAVVVPVGKEVAIDLGGNEITTGARNHDDHQYALNIYGTVTLTNGTINARGVEVREDAKLVIGEGVAINAVDANGGAAVYLYAGAEVEINGGTFKALATTNQTKGGTVVLNVGGTVTINGGTFTSEVNGPYVITNSKPNGGEAGTITINGGTFNASRGVVGANAGTITINGGTFTKTTDFASSYVVYTGGTGKVVINDGTFSTAGDASTMFCGAGVEDKR